MRGNKTLGGGVETESKGCFCAWLPVWKAGRRLYYWTHHDIMGSQSSDNRHFRYTLEVLVSLERGHRSEKPGGAGFSEWHYCRIPRDMKAPGTLPWRQHRLRKQQPSQKTFLPIKERCPLLCIISWHLGKEEEERRHLQMGRIVSPESAIFTLKSEEMNHTCHCFHIQYVIIFHNSIKIM